MVMGIGVWPGDGGEGNTSPKLVAPTEREQSEREQSEQGKSESKSRASETESEVIKSSTRAGRCEQE